MRYVYAFVLVVLFIQPSLAQQAEKIDSAANAQIRDEGMNRSQVMEVLSYISDIYGPRLAGSPAYRAAADWARARLESIGLSNPHLEAWGPFGRGWTLKHYSANVIARQVFPLISYPKAWSPGTGGKLTAEVVYLDASSDSALEAYHGKLKGKFVLMGDARELKPPFEPEAQRMADTSLLKLANSDLQRSDRMRRFDMGGPDRRTRALLAFHKLELCQKEGVAGVLTASFGDGGNVFVDAATVPVHPDTPFTKRVSSHDLNPPKIPTQVAVGAEHFNRLVRMIQKGEHPKLEMELEVNFNRADSGYNIIAEIPGTDLKDEIVMIGGHFDSWHGGTGATDNGTGSAVCIEAMRILKALKLQPRRTIRIGLWDAEEYGFYGSRAYVAKHFAEREGGGFDPAAKITYKPEWEKFSVYFNNDNGGGKVRGVWMQGNEAVRPIFRTWLKPFRDLGAATLTPLNTGGTDHQTFDGVGLPGFQFIQDEIDYGTRTHHSTMDLYDRVVPDDLKQAATIMAAFAYDAAMRDERIPRKPLPTPQAPAAPAGR
jgi:carboxypeptidase Q